jgi:glycosyltransferase involved in cell wall biosynthesis
MKKLLFITWSVSYGYGTEKSLADVVNRMNPAEYDIDILPLFKRSNSTIFNDNIHILEALIDYTTADFDEQEALKRYYSLLGEPVQFRKTVRSKYDCIIACNHNAPSYFASYLTAEVKLLWIRGDMSELDYRGLAQNTGQYQQIKQEYDMQEKVFQSFDVIVVISDVVKQTLSELFGITQNVIKISNSVDSEKIIRLSKEGVDIPDKMLFTTLGRLDDNKNQMLLLKAAKELKNQRDDFIIYILGDGDNREKLEKYIRNNQLEEQVKILGFIENPYPYIKNSIATILTSLSEGFSLVLIESLILNTPVISTDVGVARELIETYHCGELVAYDERQLASVMLRHLEQYDGYKEIFDAGEEYDIKEEVRKTTELIEHTLENADAGKKIHRLPYPEVTVSEYELEDYKIQEDEMYVLRVMKDGVPYEYLLNRVSGRDKLIVFHNGAVEGGNVTVPVFQRHSLAKHLVTSSVFCMDSTLYLDGYLQIGWGVGKDENYYLENSSLILKKIIQKMKISLEDTVIYGTSAGGYLAIMMGIYLKGAKVVADNAQLDVRHWIYKDALDAIMDSCFAHAGDALKYPERFSVVDAFQKHHYVPKIYLHVNLCSDADNTTQLVPFLQCAEKMREIKEYHGIEVVLHFRPDKGHEGMSPEETERFLYAALGETENRKES